MAAEHSHDYTPTVLRLPKWNGGRTEIPAARAHDSAALYVPVAYLCETILGIDKRTQSAIIRDRFAEGTEWRQEVPFRLGHAWRMMLAIRTPEAALWVLGIDPKRVKASARDSLGQFCDEMKHEAERLLFGVAPRAPERLRGTALASHVSVTVTMACEECGAEHDIRIEDDVVTVTLRRG